MNKDQEDIYIRQKEVMMEYGISYFHLSKLKKDKIIHPYKSIFSEREVLFKKEEIDRVLNEFIRMGRNGLGHSDDGH